MLKFCQKVFQKSIKFFHQDNHFEGDFLIKGDEHQNLVVHLLKKEEQFEPTNISLL